MVLVDTNVLLHAVNTESPHHDDCVRALTELADNQIGLAVCWSVLYQYLRIATHPGVFRQPLTFDDAWSTVTDLLDDPRWVLVGETVDHRSVAEACAADAARLAGNRVHDFHIAVLAHEHGIRQILTLDQDFRACPWVALRRP